MVVLAVNPWHVLMILRGTVFVGWGEYLGFFRSFEAVKLATVVMLTAPIQSSIQRSAGVYEVGLGIGGEGMLGEIEALTFYSYNITRAPFHSSQKSGGQNCI